LLQGFKDKKNTCGTKPVNLWSILMIKKPVGSICAPALHALGVQFHGLSPRGEKKNTGRLAILTAMKNEGWK